jgi:AraC-like DNA-binding protein
MKAILQKVPVLSDASFCIQEFRSAYFETPWHFHPECELVLIIKGEGKRFVGDHIADFGPGNLVLLGPNQPHWYRSSEAYYSDNPGLECVSIVIQFSKEFLGNAFFELPEALTIRKFLEKAALGIEITGSTREKVARMVQDIPSEHGMKRLIHLLTMLSILSDSREYDILSSQSATGIHMNDSERIDRVYQYVMDNFTDPITLEDVSGILHMGTSTFCRFFKKRTRKNFMLFLNEIRIGHACKMLIEAEQSITEICYMSGFNNISYFNRQFKSIKNMTPQAFRQLYVERQFS